jgi:membrane protease YdiL (CAAX protease family)
MIASRSEDKVFGSMLVIVAAIVIFFGLSAVMMSVAAMIPFQHQIMLMYLAGMIFLLAILFPYHRWVAPTGPGHVFRRMSVGLLLAVVAICFIGFMYEDMTHHLREHSGRDMLSLPLWQMLLGVLLSLAFEPITEEIMVRGFLLNVFRTSHPWTIWAGAVFISLLYAGVYSQYSVNARAEIMMLSFIFCGARISSDGLLLPVLLHSLTAILRMLL